jgi:hypothetical protein
MPIIQQPTLQVIDQNHQQFQVQFGIEMSIADPQVPFNIPNLFSAVGSAYTVDLTQVNTPARGNFPAIRCLQFVLQTAQIAAGEVAVGNVYIVNARTSQVLAILAPTPGPGFSSLVMGNLPFFAQSTQSILVYRATSVNCVAFLSATAFTFDSSSFLTSMIPAPTLYQDGSGFIPTVQIANQPISVDITGQPIDVTVVP